MVWWTQIITAAISIICFMVLVAINRRQDAMPQVYMLSILLMISGLFVPDTWVLLPLLIPNVMVLRAWNIRVMLAILLGILTVGLYGSLAWLIWPDAAAITSTMHTITDAFQRDWGIYVLPMWMQITTAALLTLGLIAQMAHFSRYSSANVRIQTRLLLVTPVYWVAVLSLIYPATTGSCMMAILWIASLYYVLLYLQTYGMPKMPSLRRKHDPYRRSYKRRRR